MVSFVSSSLLQPSVIVMMFFCLLANVSRVRSQGCSDAGFCTMEAFHGGPENVADSTRPTTVGVTLGYGIGDERIHVVSPRIDVRHHVSATWAIDLRLTGQAVSGDLGSTVGVGDAIVSTTYAPDSMVQVTAGVKVPFGNGDLGAEGRTLPMDYQPSLGTTDLIVGVGLAFGRWHTMLAAQIPLTQNASTFAPEAYPPTSVASRYPATTGFHRKADVLVRVGYTIPLTDDGRWLLTPSLLPIIHTANDTYIRAGVRQAIGGSSGVTFNVSATMDYRLSPGSMLAITAGAPVLFREQRPDGLTRKLVIAVGYTFPVSSP